MPNESDTVVGIDIAFFSQAKLDQQTDATTMIVGAPVLAVEVLSPSDKQDDIIEKLEVYLTAGFLCVRC